MQKSATERKIKKAPAELNKKELSEIFSQSLDLMDTISKIARDKIWAPNGDEIINGDKWPNPPKKNPYESAQTGYKLLMIRPLLTRVRVFNFKEEREEVYFFAESTVSVPGILFGSYYSPKGRLAALRVGSREGFFEVLEKTEYIPKKTEDQLWDSENTTHANRVLPMLTIRSLREWLENFLGKKRETPREESKGIVEDLNSFTLFEEGINPFEDANISFSITHEPIRNYGIRNRVILDEVQDERNLCTNMQPRRGFAI